MTKSRIRQVRAPLRKLWIAAGDRLDPLQARVFRWLHHSQERFRCPICAYEGPFQTVSGAAGRRRHARCPGCGASERLRIQRLTLDRLLSRLRPQSMRVLHVAPERALARYLATRFGVYVSLDLHREDVDVRADLCALPFPEGAFDLVFASHVLEHIPDDTSALREIHRVLSAKGVAVLPVPIISMGATVEYGEPNPLEDGHVRAPGPDYFDRYRSLFARVECHASSDFPAEAQVYIYEDRSAWPNARMPKRPGSAGERHIDFVPVCFKSRED